MSIHAYKLKDGGKRFRVDFYPNGRTGPHITRRGFVTKTAAKEFEVKEKAKVLNGEIISTRKVTLENYLEDWFCNSAKIVRQMSDYSHMRVRQHLNHIIPELGHIKLEDLRPSHMNSFREKKKKELAVRTIINMEACLKGALNDAVGSIIQINPLMKLKPLKIELKDEQEIQVFEPEEQKRLMEAARTYAAKHNDQRWFMRPYIALQTGMRSGEITALKWSDIDLKEGLLRIEKSVHYAEGDTKARLKKPKTKKGIRTIDLTNSQIEEINKYRIWVSKKLLKAKMKITKETPFIFANDMGMLHRSASRRRWETLLRNANLEHRGFHTLRHTHASNLISQNVNMKYISERLGHASIMITMDIYGHCFKNDSRQQIENAMNAIEARSST